MPSFGALVHKKVVSYFVASIAVSLLMAPSAFASTITPNANLASGSSSQSQQYLLDATDAKAVNASAYSAFFQKNGGSKTTSLSAGISPLVVTPVATLSLFADPTSNGSGGSGSSGGAFGTHAFITVKNNSSTYQTVGKFSIAPGKSLSIGTWGNKTEHVGLWYDLEAKFVATYGYYSGRISVAYIMNATELSTLNSKIVNGDYWSLTSNCSTFASTAWNNVVPTAYRVSAGIPNTPLNLANSIKSVFAGGYSTGAPAPYDYLVYYANGTGTPIRSTMY